MKKILSLLLIFCMFFSMPVFADEYKGYREIKVGLFFGSTAKDSIEIASAGGFNICFGEDKNFGYHYSMLEEAMTVTTAGEDDYNLGVNFTLVDGQIAIRPARGVISVNGVPYRGFILLKREKNSPMTVINVVDVESYLYSVVGKEMSPSWNIEALKAQAICARTFVFKNLGKYKSYGFDLCTTQASQVYGGINAEYPSTVQAVNETAYQIIKYDGKPCEVFYFSSSGGVTESVENVWSTALPHLKSKEDPYENPKEATRYTWKKTFTKEELKETLAKKGVEIGDIKDVLVTKNAESGRVLEITFVGSEGEYKALKEKARTILSLSSQLYTVTPNEDGSFCFDGRGWGHAIGMSQWGAKAMADQGFSYEEILKFYFTGIEVE